MKIEYIYKKKVKKVFFSIKNVCKKAIRKCLKSAIIYSILKLFFIMYTVFKKYN